MIGDYKMEQCSQFESKQQNIWKQKVIHHQWNIDIHLFKKIHWKCLRGIVPTTKNERIDNNSTLNETIVALCLPH